MTRTGLLGACNYKKKDSHSGLDCHDFVTSIWYNIIMLRKDLGDFIRAKREEALLSQEELALRSNITVRTIYALEAGGSTPNFKTLRSVLQVLNLDAAEVLDREVAS